MKALARFELLICILTACSTPAPGPRQDPPAKQRAPSAETSSSSLGFQNSEPLTFEALRAKAFSMCRGEFTSPATPDIPLIDPPTDGNPDSIGLVYQEELSVLTDLAFDKTDQERTYFIVRPRLAGNKLPMEVFIKGDDGNYRRQHWEDLNIRFPSDTIRPAVDKEQIPPAGRVLSEIIVGHGTPERGYPFVFNLRSSAYARFSAYSPQVAGASLRLAAHKIFNQGARPGETSREDFPLVRAAFMALNKDGRTSNLMVLVESELFCGALNMDLDLVDDKAAGKSYGAGDSHADLTVDGFWYTRRDFNWKTDPHTALVAYSSMVWKTKKDVGTGSDQAHDSDTLVVKYAGSKSAEQHYSLQPLKQGLQIHDLTAARPKAKPVEWLLANLDRDPGHYAHFAPMLGATNYNFRDSYKVTILESNIRTGVSVYELATQFEYTDNVVAASTIRQNIKKAKTERDFVRFKYRTTAFYP